MQGFFKPDARASEGELLLAFHLTDQLPQAVQRNTTLNCGVNEFY